MGNQTKKVSVRVCVFARKAWWEYGSGERPTCTNYTVMPFTPSSHNTADDLNDSGMRQTPRFARARIDVPVDKVQNVRSAICTDQTPLVTAALRPSVLRLNHLSSALMIISLLGSAQNAM